MRRLFQIVHDVAPMLDRKRPIAVDTDGLPMVNLTISDSAGAPEIVGGARTRWPWLITCPRRRL